jgi:glucosamine 6-phosphate synthetase-like amidotransferase/phosphosugar isomerase protein
VPGRGAVDGIRARAVARSGQLVDDFPNLEIRGLAAVRNAPKMLSNTQEVRAHGANMIAVASEGDEEIAAYATHVLFVPCVPEMFALSS